MRHRRFRPAVLAMGLAAVAAAGPSVPRAADRPPAAMAEVIVKFRPGTAAAELPGAGTAPTPGSLDRLAEQLSGKVGLPLVPVRLTSGHEIVLAVDRQAFADRLAQAAEAAPGVRAAAPAPADPAPAPGRPVRIVVEPTSSAATPGDDALAVLSDAVARRVGAPVAASAADGRIALEVNPAELGTLTAQRLRALPEVEYAQPNYLVRPQRGRAETGGPLEPL